jgi:hypothetical protein
LRIGEAKRREDVTEGKAQLGTEEESAAELSVETRLVYIIPAIEDLFLSLCSSSMFLSKGKLKDQSRAVET